MRTRRVTALWVVVLACVTSSARAQTIPTVNGEPGFCFGGAAGICLLGGHWAVSGAFYEVTGAARLTLPNGLTISLPSAVNLRVGTTAETASLTGTAGLAIDAGTSGPLAGIGVAGPNVALTIGEGRDLGVRTFTLGTTTVQATPSGYYVHARFGSETRMTLPALGTVRVPTPVAGRSSELLIGLDPARPSDMVVHLSGGFAALLTGGIITDGVVLFAWGPNATMRVGPFVTSVTNDMPRWVDFAPTLRARGTFDPFGEGDDDASPKPLPITITGGFAVDVDGDRDGRRFTSLTDTRFASDDARITIDDVGLGQRLDVGVGHVYYDPSSCGPLGRLYARAESVSRTALANTSLAALDPGRSGFTFDALACGTDNLVRLRAGRVAIAGDDTSSSPFPLTNVVIGFDPRGVSVEASLAFFGSSLRLRGTFEEGALRLRSSAALALGGLPISNGAVELVVRGGRASVRLTGYVTVAGQSYGIDETFHSPTMSFSLP